MECSVEGGEHQGITAFSTGEFSPFGVPAAPYDADRCIIWQDIAWTYP